MRDRRSPALPYDIKVRILFTDSLAPSAHRFLLIVRIGVNPESVKSGIFDPPDRPLLEIPECERIIEVHVRH